ncbi:MAG: YidH family protein [Bacteroidales bacterium]
MESQAADPRTDLAKNRTSFAKFRTQLALDRTTLAWIRTALTMGTFGFGTVGFFRSVRLASPTPEAVALHASAIRFGVALIVLGVAATVLAGIAHWFALRRLRRDEAPAVARWPLSITVAMLLAVIGLVSLWQLMSP